MRSKLLLPIFVFLSLLTLFSIIPANAQRLWAETQKIPESDRQPAECKFERCH